MKLTSNISRPITYSISNPISYPINKVPSYLLQDEDTPTPFDPSSISGLRSRLLDANTFTSPIVSKYYLTDSSTINTHLPRQGRAWLFDGTNDYGTFPSGVDSTWASSFSISLWTYYTGTQSYAVSINNGNSVLVQITPTITNFGNTTGFNGHTAATTNTWIHWVFVYDSSLSGMSRWIIYKNGVLATVAPNGSLLAPTSSSGLVGIRNVGLAQPYGGFLRDLRIYSSAKDSTAVSAIYNQSLTGNGTFDETNLVACYPCNEEAGTTGYDISGNANHLTLTNITEATFHSADTGVLTNRNNDEGYRLSGSVYIPKRLSSSLAADGNALTVTGRAAYHGCAEVPCLAGGNTVYASVGTHSLTGDFELSFWCRYIGTTDATNGPMFIGGGDFASGTTYQNYIWYRPSANILYWACDGESHVITGGIANSTLDDNQWHKIKVTRSGTTHTFLLDDVVLWTGTKSVVTMTIRQILQSFASQYFLVGNMADLKITYGGVTWHFPLQDGPGSSNTNRNLAYAKSDGTGGVISNAIVNGTVSTIWGNRVPGNVEDWCIKYGGRIAANGAFVAGMLTGGNAADGSAKTLTAGKFGNPFSRLNLNPATAAELNGRSVPTAATVSTNINTTITPSNSAFERTKTDGDDRILIYDSSLTGSDLTNVQEYIA